MPNCVTKYFRKKGTEFTETPGAVIAVKIDNNFTWDFYSDNYFVAFEGGVSYIVGKWQCDGDENFIITGNVTKRDTTKKKQTFSSKTPEKWTDTNDSPTTPPVEQEPEEEPEQSTEPDFDRTKFPLKKGSEGKEVIQLQNYLNQEIPTNPLVIDGIFGNLTHNKLVQVQKKK